MNEQTQPAVAGPVEPTVRPDPMRDAFEAWYSNDGKWPAAVERSFYGPGYRLGAADHAWNAWQACWPLARAAIYSAEQAQIEAPLRNEIERLRAEAAFYKRRVQALEQWQSRMRDPERTVVCDILANGFTLDPPVPSDRYEVKRGEETLDEAGAAAAALYDRWTGKA